jgi:LPS export ABC transporter protein LptC
MFQTRDMEDPVVLFSAIMLFITVFFVFLCLVIFACGDKADKMSDSDDSTAVAAVRPDQQIRLAKISLYDGPYKTTDLQADYIEKYEKYDSTLAWNLVVLFFDSAGHRVSDLVADSGLVREKVNFMEVYGNIVVTTEDGAVLQTEKLSHNVAQNRIETDAFVRIIQRGDTIQGYGLEADNRLRNIKIKQGVTGTLQSSEQIID